MTNTTTYGKLILMGEHSVVYGFPALAIPLRSATVQTMVTRSVEDELHLPSYQGLLKHAPASLQPLVDLIRSLRQTLKLPPLALDILTTLPIGAGLGASAALAGSIVKALHQEAGVTLSAEALHSWIQVSETAAHGNPSGVDAATVVSDRALEFVKGSSPRMLDIAFPGYLFVADSGIFGSTKEAVALVANNRQTEMGRSHLDALGHLSMAFIEDLKQGIFDRIGSHMDEAQTHLSSLGVSHPKLDEMIRLAKQHGAKGAKLTGGGLGGCMIAYADAFHDLIAIRQAFLEQGYERCWTLDLAKEFGGVRAVTARAPINIALIKYWGKRNESELLPTAPSLSLSLSRYETITRIASSQHEGVTFNLNGMNEETMLPRVKEFLKHFTNEVEATQIAIESVNTGPTAAGLASSASAFAALAFAANAYYHSNLSLSSLASITRKGSGSAVRSLLPGAVAWHEDGSIASIDLPFDDLSMGILIVDAKQKAIGSTAAMKQTMRTSPIYDVWVDQTRLQFEAIKEALAQADFAAVGEIAEANALALHHVCETAVPPIVYLTGTSKAILSSLQEARTKGMFQAYATMDAGPNVKVLCRSCDREAIERWTNEQHFPSPIWSNIDWKGASIFDE